MPAYAANSNSMWLVLSKCLTIAARYGIKRSNLSE
jgi:hypothetical protein